MSLPSTGDVVQAPQLTIRGARVHNLKNISLTLPRNQLIVITGVSGSGKTSLAFDTIYAEGQRRYVESLSSYARQFLERMQKPDVDSISGLSPAIAFEQKAPPRNPRSTVGTATEIYDYLRLLFGRVGETTCPACGKKILRETVSTVLEKMKQFAVGEKFYLGFILHVFKGHSLQEHIEALLKKGYVRIYVRNELFDISDGHLPRKIKLTDKLLVVVDRIRIPPADSESWKQIADSLEVTFRDGEGRIILRAMERDEEYPFTSHFECSLDGLTFEEPEPKLFTFNSPSGACRKCEGFGRSIGVDLALVIPDESKTLVDGAIHPWTFPAWRENQYELEKLAPSIGIPLDIPISAFSAEQRKRLLHGHRKYEGIYGFFDWLERKSYKIQNRVFQSRYRGYTICDECGGSRLRKEANHILVGGKTIHQIVSMQIETSSLFFTNLQLDDHSFAIVRRVITEIRRRLKLLVDIGLGYLTLDRLMMTLSGGENQRVSLATALGSSLVGAIYVLDEPSIGLHPRDGGKLIAMLKQLRAKGNTVIVVEHDEEMIRSADHVVDMGPLAGELGGEVVFQGSGQELMTSSTLTSEYLTGRKFIALKGKPRKHGKSAIIIECARHHNLKNITVKIPLNALVCVTGVSGSGKSTLVHEVLYKGLGKKFGTGTATPGRHSSIVIEGQLSGVELVDQTPVGRSPRSNPATYTKAFDGIRDLLAGTTHSRMRGFTATHFSFNVPGGRCETCEGDGVQVVEMQFLADVVLECEGCRGSRFKKEVLEVRFHGKNVNDILKMTVSESLIFFLQFPQAKKVVARLKILDEVGLGYLRLGQSSTTLSGGEAQRMKLAFHLSEQNGAAKKLFIFDEPTTGLHFDDISKLMGCFERLLDSGHSVLVIEHNLDVIKNADHVIDLGPEGGENGGMIIYQGALRSLMKHPKSFTAKALRKHLTL